MKAHYFVLLLLCMFVMIQESHAQLIGFRTWTATVEPSNINTNEQNIVQRGWACFDFRKPGLSVDCPVTFELFQSTVPFGVDGITTDCIFDANGRTAPRTCGHGGHLHESPARPTLFSNTEVRYPGDMDNNPLTVTGAFSPGDLNTGFQWTVPQVGGYYRYKSTMEAPGNSRFVTFSNGILTFVDKLEANGTVNVTFGRDSLKQLPDDNVDFYIKARGGAATHPDNASYAAQDITISALRAIGRTFKRNTDSLISYNDISLPKGAIFEAFATNPPWVGPHFEHREGLEIDINRRRDASNNPIRCDMNTSIQAAVDAILTRNPDNPDPNSKSALLCETAISGFRTDPGTYHLNVTNLKLLSGFSGFFL